ncbi:MAG TPA: FAD:protein FMN transferase [Flexivirga sp.]|uniref:FAD:protein FMN transferase n=1 Tax=Flexivirga sp. TaxID=1962927 RepID=UPI002CD52633|nr:FAD:protein FMN transferase [Flexivirga sp.]HWC23754.1 FAD:protein FMN transferase [Flexivirga sp.]
MRTIPVLAAQFSAIGTSCRILVTSRFTATRAGEIALHDVERLDDVASRFRSDSEIRRLANNGLPQRVSPLLGDVVEAALRAAVLTDGLVDPTIGAAMEAFGYDDDLDVVRARGDRPVSGPPARSTWRSIRYDAALHLLAVPPGGVLDFGASAKALLADRIAASIHDETGSGVLVDLGGDIATAGAPPAGGWRIGVEGPSGKVVQTVLGSGQAFATSSTALRTWTSAGVQRHHIIDPRTGSPAEVVWRQVTVAGRTALEANSASTAAVVLGSAAPSWLAARGLPALLIGADGSRRHTPGWPEEGAA